MAKRKADPIQEVLSKHVTTVSEWGMLRELDGYEHEMVRRAIEVISPIADGAPLRLYRGESKTNLRRQLLPPLAADLPDDLLYTRLFLFGEKARHFSRDSDEALRGRRWLRYISDTTSDTFAWLFDQIHRIIRYRYNHVQRFRADNPEFAVFFSDPQSKSEFRRRALGLFPTCRAHVRDYYLYFLHTYGRKGIDRETPLVSTSEARSQARRFQGRGKEGVLLYIFLPSRYRRNAVSSRVGPAFDSAVRRSGLPTYQPGAELYAKQREVALRGAVFPQYIFGVEDNATNQFIVNPHLLQMRLEDIVGITRHGIAIDQRAFDLLIRETGFYRYVRAERRGRLTGLPISRVSSIYHVGLTNPHWSGS